MPWHPMASRGIPWKVPWRGKVHGLSWVSLHIASHGKTPGIHTVGCNGITWMPWETMASPLTREGPWVVMGIPSHGIPWGASSHPSHGMPWDNMDAMERPLTREGPWVTMGIASNGIPWGNLLASTPWNAMRYHEKFPDTERHMGSHGHKEPSYDRGGWGGTPIFSLQVLTNNSMGGAYSEIKKAQKKN